MNTDKKSDTILPKIVEISMAHNQPYMIEDKWLIESILKAGFKVSCDFMWVIEVHSNEDVEKIKDIFLKSKNHQNKNFIVR